MPDEGHYITELILQETEADVARVYTQAVEETQKKLDDYLQRLQTKDKIKQEQVQNGEITEQEYNQWRVGQIMIGQRWEEMRDTLAEDLHNANNLARSIVNGHMPEVYAVNHNYATFQIEKESMLDTSYTLYDRDTVERIIRDQPDILPAPGPQKSRRIAEGKDIAWQRGQIQSVTLQSILQGESIPNMAKRISTTLGERDYHSAVRYARTATTGAENAGRVDAYERAAEMGIDVKQEWMATLDNRTRHSHVFMDGEIVESGEMFSNGCRYPGDPDGPPEEIWNCRCTLVPVVGDVDQSNAPRNSKLGSMTYEEWKEEHAKQVELEAFVPGLQGEIGRAKTVDEINDIMNSQGWFRTNRAGITSEADLTGCDLESAKSIASSYQQVFEKYPQLAGKFDAPNAQPIGMKKSTYAWCYTRSNGMVQVNPNRYNDWNALSASYEKDVVSHWHCQGTTAESIITHEIGHAIDGFLANEGILGGYNAAGEFRTASSLLRSPIMKKCGYTVNDVPSQVSVYAAENTREWFAECFAEYITSAAPRPVASALGEKLEELMEKVN